MLAAIDPEETIAFLRDLVRAPSVNPPGDVSAAAAVCAHGAWTRRDSPALWVPLAGGATTALAAIVAAFAGTL